MTKYQVKPFNRIIRILVLFSTFLVGAIIFFHNQNFNGLIIALIFCGIAAAGASTLFLEILEEQK